jgi:hypothetical protein
MLSVGVYDTTAVTLLMQCRLAEIAEHFDKLTLPLPEAPSECFEEIEIVCRDDDDTETLRLDFDFRTDVERWAKPWSIADFASTLKRVVEACSVPGLCYYQPGGEFILDGRLGLDVAVQQYAANVHHLR